MKTERDRICGGDSAEEYERLKRCDRRAISAGEVLDRHVAALREAKVPDRFADLDTELKGWKR